MAVRIPVGWRARTQPVKKFSNIPASYRAVPLHPDDDSSGQRTATIPDSTLEPPNIRLWHYMPTTGVTLYERVTARVGFDFQSGGKTKVAPGNGGYHPRSGHLLGHLQPQCRGIARILRLAKAIVVTDSRSCSRS